MHDNLAFKYPPNIDQSILHRNANRIFRKLNFNQFTQTRCQCCGRFVGQQSDIGYCYDPVKDLQFLGPGIPLMFVFMQNSMFLLLTLILIVTTYAFLSNIFSDSCQKVVLKCNNDFYSLLSISNKLFDDVDLTVQIYLILVMTVFWILFVHIFIYRIRKIYYEHDVNLSTPSDYAIIIENLPDFVTTNDILEFIKHYSQKLNKDQKNQSQNLLVHNIILPFKNQEYQLLRVQQQQLFKQFISNGGDCLQFHVEKIPKPTEPSNIAIVIFQKQISKEFFIRESGIVNDIKNALCNWGLDTNQFQINRRGVMITRAPQPDQILWHNIGKSSKKILTNKIITFSLGIILLFCAGVIQYLLAVWQQSTESPTYQKTISAISTAIILLTNYAITAYLRWSTKKQGNLTMSQQNQSLTIKICYYQFFNSGIFYTFANVFAVQFNLVNLEQIFTYKVTSFMILNALSQPFSDFVLHYFELEHLVEQFCFRNKCRIYTQKECNEIYQMPDCQISFKYAYIIKSLWLTAFYSTYVPIASLITLIGFFLYYLTTKFLFRYCYKTPHIWSNEMNRGALRKINFVPLYLNIGQFLIYLYLTDSLDQYQSLQIKVIVLLSLALSILFVLMPWFDINKKILPLMNKVNQKYSDCKIKFETTYEMVSPLYQGQRTAQRDNNMLRFQCKNLIKDPNFFNIPISKQIIQSMGELPMPPQLLTSARRFLSAPGQQSPIK